MAVNFRAKIIDFPQNNQFRMNVEQNYPEDYPLAQNALDLLENPAATVEEYYEFICYFIAPNLTNEELSSMPAEEFQQLLGSLRQEVQTILADAPQP